MDNIYKYRIDILWTVFTSIYAHLVSDIQVHGEDRLVELFIYINTYPPH
jgi:hypothetical protein